jgi:pSer/pThr/pTyr-binding forkhead associated (FHA) protein
MNLKELEARLQSLIEVRLISVLPGQKPQDLLVQRLTEAMQSGATTNGTGQLTAPNVYTLLAHPNSIAYWKKPELLETLVDILETAAVEANLRFDVAPSITIAEDLTVAPGAFNLIASYRTRTGSLAETKDMQTGGENSSDGKESATIPEDAYLIIEGVKVFQLDQAVVNIGRRVENTLVIDDPRVSRNHAQLRAIKGRYVLFDLNSTGGTFINGQRANQTVLYPGDVISLAGVSLIFGQDNPVARQDLSETSPRNDAGADRSTAVIHITRPRPKKGK